MNQRNAIRELRNRLKLNQYEFAKKIGKSKQTIDRYEADLPEDLALAFAELARQSGYLDLVRAFRDLADSDFSDNRNQYSAQEKRTSTETAKDASIPTEEAAHSVTGDTNKAPMVSFNTHAGNLQYHQWLDQILKSGVSRYIPGIVAMLELGAKEIELPRGANFEGSGNKKAAAGSESSANRKAEQTIATVEETLGTPRRSKRTDKRNTG